jgi:deoxyribodipyrimidine photo-lyase
MNRRVESNHALAHAIQLGNQLRLPVLFYEGLTCTYRYANARLHTFVLEGVPETARRCAERGLGYAFYLRRRRDDRSRALFHLAQHAAALVTDDYPTFIAADHNARLPAQFDLPYLVVDSSCVVPMNRHPKREYAAYTIRPKIHKVWADYLHPFETGRPQVPYTAACPSWHTAVTDANIPELVASCDIDHSVPPSTTFRGGRLAAEKHLQHFLAHNLRRYARERNEPSAHATSGLSPYLHFGHLSALEVATAAKQHAAEHRLIADEFLEELIVRRELAFNFARHSGDPEALTNLPAWALDTLRKHQADVRDPVYTRDDFEQARTHDELWNATQREMLLRGKIHGYYRMYWGKKIIEWSPGPEEALATMIYLHDRYALDGRDPNTYTNILWCFGLHDRPWTERAIFGMTRYMSYDGMKRKTDTQAYLREINHLALTRKDPHRIP